MSHVVENQHKVAYKVAYKIFECSDDGQPQTLFHGLNGSRTLTTGQWLDATAKWVKDGSQQRYYLSGFHAYPTVSEIVEWSRRVKKRNNRFVVRVLLQDVEYKGRAMCKTYLAGKMKIPTVSWQSRISLEDFVEMANGL